MNDLLDLALYLKLFRGREDYFALQSENGYYPVNKAFDEYYLNRHLAGDITCGIYVLNSKSYCNFICIDIDIPKSDLCEIDFLNSDDKYQYLGHKLDEVVYVLSRTLDVLPESILLEDTGGRGYHIWIFLSKPVKGQVAVMFGEVLKRHLNFEIEYFPKQGHLTQNRKYGNLIKLPLGIHRKYGSQSSFFHLSSQGPQIFSDIERNLEHLGCIVPLSPEVFERSISAHEDNLTPRKETLTPVIRPELKRSRFKGNSSILMSNCVAMRNLRLKSERGYRLTHSEAFYFANVMMSVDDGKEIIHETMQLSFKTDYNQERTNREIDKILPLYPPSCLTLVSKGVCPGYCKEGVRKKNEDPLAYNTTPCSVWLQMLPEKLMVDAGDLVKKIGAFENVRKAYLQLKRYHEHEDSLFFDPFDFEHFENRLDANCEVIAKALYEKMEIPFLGYMPVPIPKKINEAQKLEYRVMSYSSVYDQIPIQAIFNIVSPIIEDNFLPTSYGYRWNKDSSAPYRIFEDWREAYPRFRNDIIAALKQQPNGFHFCCDIKGYYDHVNHDILLEQLRKLVTDEYIYKIIECVVRAYTSEGEKECGIPQGPAYARLLANLYLNDFDIFAKQSSKNYFRYVDDFVLVFENEEDAKNVLDNIVHRLADLGLELSQDEAKKAVIEPNTDISRVLKTLDKIHYGILDGTRHLEYLTPEAVIDFMEAVKRHSVSPLNLDDLIKINDALPTLLYVVTKEPLVPHQLKPAILDIIDFLIRHKWFCPKKLKNIFYRLLDLVRDEEQLLSFFMSMEPTYKIYFLLSVFGCWQTQEEHQNLLERMVQEALRDDCVYLWGFAVAIAAKLDMDIHKSIARNELLKKSSKNGNLFGLLKWLYTIDYLGQSAEERADIRKLVGPNSQELLKIFLLGNITRLSTEYVDDVYIDGLLGHSGVMLLPVACNLLVTATNKWYLFDSLLVFILSHIKFKALVISFVTKGIFKKQETSGIAEIENLKSLYERIPDDELKRHMLSVVSRILKYGAASNVTFAKQHKQVSRYNECYFFEMISEKAKPYEFLELIPERTLLSHTQCDLDEFREIMNDFGTRKILPESNISYDSGQSEIRIEFKIDKRYKELAPDDFSRKPDSILKACIIAADIYRKACYFKRFIGKAPHISYDNLLVDPSTGSILFRTIGRSLCALHVFGGVTVGDEEADIARMISMLLEALMFKTRFESMEFMKEKTHQGIYAFLELFIKKMANKHPEQRYTCSRFVYMVDELKKAYFSDKMQPMLEIVYLRERLKGALFRFNSQAVTWHGICLALNEHISEHIWAVCSHEMIQAFPFRSRTRFSDWSKLRFHSVSRYLLDLALCREDLSDLEENNKEYLDLVEFLLLYASICLEIVALGRTLQNSCSFKDFQSLLLRPEDNVQIKAGDLIKGVVIGDIATLVIRLSKNTVEGAIAALALRQISLQTLFSIGIEIGNVITVKRPRALQEDVFKMYAHTCLFRIPKIEMIAEEQIRQILLALQHNENFSSLDHLVQLRDEFRIVSEDLRRIRSGLKLVRQYGRASGRYFPQYILCKSYFRRSLCVKDYALPGCTLTNSIPSKKKDGYICSWDMRDKSIKNLVIPDEGLNSLIQDLTKGKLMGLKFSYLYSGKTMLLLDASVLIILSFIWMFLNLESGSSANPTFATGFFRYLELLFGGLGFLLFLKLLGEDLGHWYPWAWKVTDILSKKTKRLINKY